MAAETSITHRVGRHLTTCCHACRLSALLLGPARKDTHPQGCNSANSGRGHSTSGAGPKAVAGRLACPCRCLAPYDNVRGNECVSPRAGSVLAPPATKARRPTLRSTQSWLTVLLLCQIPSDCKPAPGRLIHRGSVRDTSHERGNGMHRWASSPQPGCSKS